MAKSTSLVVNGKKWTAQDIEALLATVKVAREPGFYNDTDKLSETDQTYTVMKFTRVLPNKGGEIVWEIKRNDGFLACKINLRFGKGKTGQYAIPGFGGDDARWAVYDSYFLEGDYVADRKILRDVQRKYVATLAKVTK